jgi:enoyl-CoA hydratase/carnithine racemase
MELTDYQDRFSVAAVTRDSAGVLTIRLHSKGGTLWWGARPHRELPELFAAVASDRANRVVVITGTGDSFITIPEFGQIDALPKGRVSATDWDQTIWEGNRLVNQLLDIEVPVIAAVNGPVTVHSEIAVLADIVLATPETYFQDKAHEALGARRQTRSRWYTFAAFL